MPDTATRATKALIEGYFQLYPGEAARWLSTFPVDDVRRHLEDEPVTRAAPVFTHLSPDIAATVLARFGDSYFIALATALDPSLSARLLSRLDADTIAKRLALLPANLAEELRQLMAYPRETAGYLMDPRVITFRPDDTIDDVFQKIRAAGSRRILTVYVLDEEGRLIGALPLHEVAVARPERRLEELIARVPVTIQAMSPAEDVVELLEEQRLISLPVIDMDGRLLGIIRNDALVDAARQDATKDIQAMFGAGRDERALSSVTFAIRKRLPWLEINLATAFLASAVVGLFEETIARITVLAVFLPVVAGQSGNTGSQALAVTMRGLALREIRSRHWFQVARKEIMVGFVNGCAIALTTGTIVLFWTGSIGLATVICISMVISMVIAGMAGAVIPIILKSLGQDPAQSSSIILTTVTDVVGFFSFLGLATVLSAAFNLG